MFGPSLLATPLYGDDFATATTRDVYLPAGKWLDYDTGKIYTGPQMLKGFALPVGKTPLFVGGKGVLVVQEHLNGPLTAMVYPVASRGSAYRFTHRDGTTRTTIVNDHTGWNIAALRVTDATDGQPVSFTSDPRTDAVKFDITPGHDYRLTGGDSPASSSQRVYRIMPLGASITEGGKAFTGYRYPLYEKLTQAGYHFKYVGSRVSASPAGPLAHEGYSGKNAEFLAAHIGKLFHEHPADIVLLHAGHNHDSAEHPVPKIIAATESIIKTLRAENPQVVVLLAQAIPNGKQPKYAYIPQLNEQIAVLAAKLNSPAQPVILVNQAAGFDWRTDTIADMVHPNAQGAEKMAAKWFAALTNVLGTAPGLTPRLSTQGNK
jgi:lysophospholipase L1-like esterase